MNSDAQFPIHGTEINEISDDDVDGDNLSYDSIGSDRSYILRMQSLGIIPSMMLTKNTTQQQNNDIDNELPSAFCPEVIQTRQKRNQLPTIEFLYNPTNAPIHENDIEKNRNQSDDQSDFQRSIINDSSECSSLQANSLELGSLFKSNQNLGEFTCGVRARLSNVRKCYTPENKELQKYSLFNHSLYRVKKPTHSQIRKQNEMNSNLLKLQSGTIKSGVINPRVDCSSKPSKRETPEYTEKSYNRARKYWAFINNQNAFKGLLKVEESMLKRYGLKPVEKEIIKMHIVASLLPNYVVVDNFNNFQDKDGWVYETSDLREMSECLSLRWCGQIQNFYKPFVIRYRTDKFGKQQLDKQALCPYCPFEKDMNFDNIFHQIANSSYLHHVTKLHGVYSTGYEFAIPFFGMDKNDVFAVCRHCGDKCKLIFHKKNDILRNCMISFNRHVLTFHNDRRNRRSPERIREDERNFEKHKDFLVYEALEDAFG